MSLPVVRVTNGNQESACGLNEESFIGVFPTMLHVIGS